MYNLLEKQFYRYYDKARRMSGVVGESMPVPVGNKTRQPCIPCRLCTFHPSGSSMVTHGLINVDGKRVDIPSYPVRAGQVISLREAYRANEMFEQSFQELKPFDLPYIERASTTGQLSNQIPAER